MALKKKYQTKESAIASYDYTDLAEGTGVVSFFGSDNRSISGPGRLYSLSKGVLYSNDINTQEANTTATFVLLLEKDFDVVFNQPQNLKGIVKINITLGGRTVSTAPNTWECYAILKLKHVEDAIDIGEAQTETVTGGGGGINVHASKTLQAIIDASSTAIHFKPGETLRMTVEIWGKRPSGGSSNVGFGHDPKGRLDETPANGGIIRDEDSTIFQINVPFIIPTL